MQVANVVECVYTLRKVDPATFSIIPAKDICIEKILRKETFAMIFNFKVFFDACKDAVTGKPSQKDLGEWLFKFDKGIQEKGIDNGQLSRLLQRDVMIPDPKTGELKSKYKETGKKLEQILTATRSKDIVSYFRACFNDANASIRIRSEEKILPAFSRLLEKAENITEKQKASLLQYACKETLPEFFTSLLYFSITEEVLLIPPAFSRNLPTGLHLRKFWLSRENEHKQLRQLLDAGEKEIFVVGDGGLGKSEFVISFAHLESDYDCHFASYHNSLEDVVRSLSFEGWESEWFDPRTKQMVAKTAAQQYQEKMQLLRKYKLTDKVVLIIDNFDGDAQTLLLDPVREELSRLDIRLVYTTRMRLTGKAYVEIAPFPVMRFLPLTEYYLGKRYSFNELTPLIMQVNNNTLLVDLITRLLSDSVLSLTPTELLKALKQQSWTSIREKVSGTRDDSEKSILNHLLTLFDVSGLSQDDCYVLSCATLLPPGGFESALLLECLGEDEKWLDATRNLRRSGWLSFDQQTARISLQPLIQTALLHNKQTEPIWDRIADFVDNACNVAKQSDVSYLRALQLRSLFMGIVCKISFPQQLWNSYAPIITNIISLSARCGEYQDAIDYLQPFLSYLANGPQESPINVFFLKKQAGYCLLSGDYLQASTIYERIVEIAKSNPRELSVSLAYSELSMCFSKMMDHVRSEAAGVLALLSAPEDPENVQNATFVAYGALYSAYLAAGNPEKALEYATKQLALMENTSADFIDLVEVYDNLNAVHRHLAQHEEALTYARKMLALCKDSKQANLYLLARAYTAMATSLLRLKQCEEAFDYAQQALQINMKILPLHDPALAQCHDNLMYYYVFCADVQRAKHHASEAKRILLMTLPETHPTVQYEMDMLKLLSEAHI